ncbi:MAG: EamA family transporter [Halofilum sp. (in: g-proteobacteria)]|nr:EamA family transporter [Halofilum sp. (in: g-proteobacteria)]
MAVTRAATQAPGDSAPLVGIAFMCAGVLCLTINDVFAKWLGQFYPVPEVVFFRMLLALPLIAGVGLAFGGRRALATRRPLAHLGRGLLATCAALTFFLGLTLLPLAEVSAIAFTAPLFVTLLAVPLLGERPHRAVGGRRRRGLRGRAADRARARRHSRSPRSRRSPPRCPTAC